MNGAPAPCVFGEIAQCVMAGEKTLAAAKTSGLDDVLGRGSEVSAGGTELYFTSAEMRGAGTRGEQEVMESGDRIRLSRAPRMKYKYLLSNRAQLMSRALEYFRRAAKETDSGLVRAASVKR